MSTSRFVEELPAASRTWAVLFGSAGTNWTMLFPSRPIPWIASMSYIGHRLDRAQVTQTRRHGGRTTDAWQVHSSIEKRRHEIVMDIVGQARVDSDESGKLCPMYPCSRCGRDVRSMMTFGRTSPETLPKELAELRELMRSQPDR